MTAITSPRLQHTIETVSVPGILIAYRVISEGDERALLPGEFEAFAGSVMKVRRASGASRMLARTLLARLGQPQQAVAKSASGMPIWPGGIVGSLAHASDVAVAAVAMRRDFWGIGVDIEPATALDPDLLALIATAREREQIAGDPFRGRLLFSIKEAVYKASYPLEGTFLDHHDVEVDLATETAVTCDGRMMNFRYGISSHIVALAYVATPNSAR